MREINFEKAWFADDLNRLYRILEICEKYGFQLAGGDEVGYVLSISPEYVAADPKRIFGVLNIIFIVFLSLLDNAWDFIIHPENWE